MVSLDGYFEGNDHDLSWHNVDEEFETFANTQLDETDTLLFGHTTYEMMASYWPEAYAEEPEDGTAVRMNALHKIVFSHQMFEATWENTEVATDLTAKINELRSREGKDIVVMGSSHLGKEMIEAGLLDEVRIMVNPVFVGDGSTLFEGLNKKLTLTSTQAFQNGNVLLRYAVK